MNTKFIRHFACFHCGKKGFTLIELLVVIAVLGALVAVAIPAIAQFIGSGETEAADTELDNVRVAVTAALSEASDPGTLDVTYNDTGILAKPEPAGSPGDPARYLMNNTEYAYTITEDGTTTRHDKAVSWI